MSWPDELYKGIPIPKPETAWLIERDNDGLEYADGQGWSRDYRSALRFLSEADAANFAERAYKMVWTGERADYFDWHDFTRISEHRWG